MDNLILRASVYNYNYSAWGVGVSGPEDEWSVEYNFGLGYRPIKNVLLDVAYASMGDSRPVDIAGSWTDSFKYSFPSVNFGVTVDL
jgi:hypothetical protein